MKKGLAKFSHDDLTTDETSTGWNYLNMNVSLIQIIIVVVNERLTTVNVKEAPNYFNRQGKRNGQNKKIQNANLAH